MVCGSGIWDLVDTHHTLNNIQSKWHRDVENRALKEVLKLTYLVNQERISRSPTRSVEWSVWTYSQKRFQQTIQVFTSVSGLALFPLPSAWVQS